MPFPDLSLYVPVVCETDSKYAGKCYMEKISAVRTLNGNPVSKETDLKKSDFKTGDIVTIRFQTKDFRGTVDFSRDEEVLYERGDSLRTPRSTGSPAKGSPPQPSRSRGPVTRPDSKRTPRKKFRSWDGHEAGVTRSPLKPRELARSLVFQVHVRMAYGLVIWI